MYCVAADRMTDGLGALMSLQRLTTDSHDCFPVVTALLGLLCDLLGKQREEFSVSSGAERLTDLQITHGKKQIGLICEHACTCAQGKRHQELCCCKLSQSIQLFHTPKRQHTSDRIPVMHLSLLHFPCLDLGSSKSYSTLK